MKKNLEQQEKELEEKMRAFEAEREAWEEQYKSDDQYVEWQLPVMWSETVGLRTRPVSDQKKSVLVLHAMVLVLQVWCCVVKHGLVTLVVIVNLKTQQLFNYYL